MLKGVDMLELPRDMEYMRGFEAEYPNVCTARGRNFLSMGCYSRFFR